MSSQPLAFDFAKPPVDVTQVSPLGVPYQGSTARTLHASHQGAVDASERVGRQMLALLTAYRQFGDLTDAEMKQHTGIQRSSVIPRRRELMKRGLVHEVGSRKNPDSGVTNCTFGLAR